MTCLSSMMQVANVRPVTAMSVVSAAFSSSARSVWATVRRWWLHTPLTALAIYCVLSVLLQENYPFSHFPMYSNPSPERPYYILADGQGQPLPTASLTGVTCPKIGKIYRTETAEVADRLTKELRKEWVAALSNKPMPKRWWTRLTSKRPSVKADHLPAEHKQAIGEKLFAYFRKEAATHKQTLPPKLQLIRMEISYHDGKISDTPEVIAKE
jgi:hypothetical protein